MNKKYKVMVNVLLYMVILSNTVSQNVSAATVDNETNRRFNHVTIEDGLSQTSSNSIFQDSKGYMWIGTGDGLNRYNGHEFKIYRYNSKDENTISGNSIKDIAEDNEGNIWVATSTGLNKINPNNSDVKRYLSRDGRIDTSHYHINSILISKNGDVLVGTDDGVNKYNKYNDTFTRIFNSLSSQRIISLEEDDKGNYWVGTDYGLNKIEKETGEVTEYYHEEDNENTISSNFITALHADNLGYLWIGTSYAGLNRINLESGEIDTYRNDAKDGLPDVRIRQILRDSRGFVWVATGGGFAKFDEENNKFITYRGNRYSTTSIVNDDILSIYEDRTGAIWIGTRIGISLFNPDNVFNYYAEDPTNSNSLSGNNISGIYEDNEGLLWIGTNESGLNILDRKNNKVTRIIDEKNSEGEYIIPHKSVREITGIDNEVWVATPGGLSKYDKQVKKWTTYTEKDGLVNNDVKVLHIDRDGTLWVGTYDGLCTFDRKGTFTDYSELLLENDINKQYFSDIYEDEDGVMWMFSDRTAGLISLNKETNEIIKYSDFNKGTTDNERSFDYIRAINSDGKGNMLLSTNHGLIKFNKETEEHVRYTEADGLVNDSIYGVLIDEFDNVWISTNYGISKFDTSKETFTNYDSVDGVQGNEFNQYSYFKSKSNEMFFGGINGLTSFMPEAIADKNYETAVAIEHIASNFGDLDLKEDIHLNYKNNQLQFRFFMPEYGDANRIKYAYKLDGLDNEWNVSEKINTVNYTNLQSGKYKFQVVGMNSNGVWGKPTSVDININMKPWKTPFAYFIYLLTLVGIIYLIVNRVKILDNMVKQRTMELNNKLNENEELYKKLLQQEMYKNNYFVNLSHELRTPLNVISSTQNLIESFNRQNIDISQQKMSYYMQAIKRNCGRLLNLIDNIINTSKIESGTYMLNIKEHDIVYLVEEVSLSMKDYIEENGINLIIEPHIEEKIILCDDLEIERVIINLLSNATKFTREKGTIEVFVWDLGDRVKISVKDNGIGIEDKYHETVFNRFSQAYSESSEEHGGSGLGLTLSRQLIELHGGRMWVESELGVGSEFIFELPTK